MHIDKDLFLEAMMFKPHDLVNDVIRQNGLELNYLADEPQKIKLHFDIIIQNIYKRHTLKLFKGILPYVAELQRLMQFYTAANKAHGEYFQESIHNITGFYVSANTNSILIQCSQCGKHTTPEPYNCLVCQNVAYCTHGCKANHKYTHEQQQCLQRVVPKIPVGVQVEVHLGSDLGHNLEIYFQHQSRASFKLKGKAFLKKIAVQLNGCRQLQKEQYHQEESKDFSALKLVKNVSQVKKGQDISLKTYDEICLIYMLDPALYQVRLALLKEGCVLKDTIKEIYNSHIHIVAVYDCPL